MVYCVVSWIRFPPTDGTRMPGSLDKVTQGLGMGCMSDVTNVSSGDVVLPGSVPTLESTEHNSSEVGASGGETQSSFTEKFPLGDSQKAPGEDLLNHLVLPPYSAGRKRGLGVDPLRPTSVATIVCGQVCEQHMWILYLRGSGTRSASCTAEELLSSFLSVEERYCKQGNQQRVRCLSR